MLAWVVIFSIDSRRATQYRHVTKNTSRQLLWNLHLQNRDARNPFRIRSYENCRVTSASFRFIRSAHSASAPSFPFLSTFNFGLSTSRLHSSCPLSFKSFSCNTYASPCKCCKQNIYCLTKSFRCNTYKKPGGGGKLLTEYNGRTSALTSLLRYFFTPFSHRKQHRLGRR